MPGLADEVGSDGHRLPPYNDLWGIPHYRREPCAQRILPSPPRRSTAAPAVVLQDHLKLGDHGPKCRASLLFTLLLYAAARITSLSDACKALRDAPSDEAVRLALIATLPDFAELQRRLNAALADNLPRTLRRSPQRMAADLVLIPYHGQPQHDPDEIYRSEAKSGTSHFHAYATLYVIRNGYRFTVALTPRSPGANPWRRS